MLNAFTGGACPKSLAGLLAGTAIFIATVGAAQASPGCDLVSNGWNDRELGPYSSFPLLDFSAGDRITLELVAQPYDWPGAVQTAEIRIVDGSNTVLESWAVTTTPRTETYTVAVDTERLSLQNYDNGSPVYIFGSCTDEPLPGPGPSSSGDRSEAVTKGFLQSRVNGILLNNPGSTSLVNRSQGSGPQQFAGVGNGATNVASNTTATAFGAPMGTAMGLGAHFGDATGRGASRFDDADEAALGSRNIQFRNSLSQMRREAAANEMERYRMALGAGNGGDLPILYEAYSPWDVWVEGRFSGFNDDGGGLDRDGHVGVLYFGGDYRITPDMIIGGLVQFDWAKDDSAALASKVDGTGWMVGPYLSARVHENVYFDLRAAWGRSNNDIDVAGAAGAFDTTRWLIRGALSGNWQYDAWRITPSAELAYVKESADAYTNSAATFVPGQSVALGRLQFGPEVGYRFVHTPDSFIEPFGAIRGVWDFDNPDVEIINGYVVGPGDFWGRLEGGLNWMTASGLYVRGSATWDGMGAGDYNGYTLQGTVNVPLN